MSGVRPASHPSAEPGAASAPRSVRRVWPVGLGAAALLVIVLAAGQPALDAPWIQGDEHIFIVNNPDVTGAAPSRPTGLRWLDVFLHTHEDLYQPVTILSYAIEWSLWGAGRIFHMRLTDVLIHALNALLLWAALRALLVRLLPQDRAPATGAAFALTLLWAAHPMLVGTYAADMGRTHLLAATFTLLSLLCHLRALRPGGARWFAGAWTALLLAMLNKPVVGWVVVAFALEWALVGLRRTLASPRIYLIGLTCLAFAVLTIRTTRQTLLLEDSPLPLFGDPLARAALGLWIYVRNFFAPLGWISTWYPPDIRTGWDYAPVWLGTLLLAAAAAGAALAARSRQTRGVAVGLVWLIAMWLPASGLVGARVLAAQDRYFYLPAMGLLLAGATGLLRWWRRDPAAGPRKLAAVVALALLLSLAGIPAGRTLCREARSTIARANRAVRLNPDDPRVMEFAAAAYDFSRNHDSLEARAALPPDFRLEMETALRRASALAEAHPQYFGTAHDRAAFHRRLSYKFWGIGRYEESLAEAERARAFEPDAKLTWLRLAHAYRALRRWEDARRAYERLLQLIPPEAPDLGLRHIEFADLLLNSFNDPARALHHYRAALAVEERLPADARRLACLGAARCEVLAGSGSDGYQLALLVLQAEPDNVEAARIVALYYLHSHRWEEAAGLYRQILDRLPCDYESLCKFQTVCRVRGDWRSAALAWRGAVESEPHNLLYRSHLVWAAACAGEASAADQADELLAVSSDNRFACLAMALLSIRAGDLKQARDWAVRARHGPQLPGAREFAWAETTLEVMVERGELPQEATLVRAVLWAELGDPAKGRRLVLEYLDARTDSPWVGLAELILEQDLRGEGAG